MTHHQQRSADNTELKRRQGCPYHITHKGENVKKRIKESVFFYILKSMWHSCGECGQLLTQFHRKYLFIYVFRMTVNMFRIRVDKSTILELRSTGCIKFHRNNVFCLKISFKVCKNCPSLLKQPTVTVNFRLIIWFMIFLNSRWHLRMHFIHNQNRFYCQRIQKISEFDLKPPLRLLCYLKKKQKKTHTNTDLKAWVEFTILKKNQQRTYELYQ